MTDEAGSGAAIRRWGVRGVVLLGVAAVIVALRLTVFAPEPVPVRLATVERGRVESTLTNSKAGTVRARRRSRLTAETGGRVVEVARREGERVEAGEVLVRLNDRTPRAQHDLALRGVEVATSRLEEACLRRDRAGRELARTQKLAESDIASEDVLDELQYARDAARVACHAAAAELASARAQVRAAQAELDKTTIVAPFTGVVAEVSTEVGEWVTPSPPLLTSPAVVDLIDPTSLYVSAPMDEVDSAQIRSGQAVKLTVDSRPGVVYDALVVRVAPYVLDVEAQNRTIEIEVELEDRASAEALLPGTSADVEVVLEVREDVLRVPTSALLEGDRVLVLEEGELVERPVTLGLRNWRYAELVDGLGAGEGVVVSLDRVGVEAGKPAVREESEGDGSGAAS
jgi:HlyD family secretion protein